MLKKLCCLLLISGLLGAPVAAQPAPSATNALDRLFTEAFEPNWFAPRFLQQVPPDAIATVIRSIQEDLGAYQGATPQGDHQYQLQFERGEVIAQLRLNAAGQFVSLTLQPSAIAPEDAIQAVQALPGTVSFLIWRDGAEWAAVEPGRTLAVGSAFKLAVLAALQRRQVEGLFPDYLVVPIRPEWRSLPSGILQDWPDDASVTIQTLATLMISLSDNTATDILMDLIGQDAIAPFAGQNQPLLTTQQAFKLKNPENADLLTAYRAHPENRAEILAQLRDRDLPSVDIFAGDAIVPDVEWFFSATELCALMAEVADNPATQVNPGLAHPARWAQVSFKGGSEPGVLNFTTALTAKTGEKYCVVLTVNDETALPEGAIAELYGRILAGLE